MEPPESHAEDDARLKSASAGADAATGGLLRVATQFGGAAVTLVSTVVVLRTLGETDFGRLSLVIALVTIVIGVSDLGLSGVGVREWIRREPGARRSLLADLLGLRLIATAVSAGLAIAGALAAGYDAQVVAGLGAAMVGAALNAVQSALTIPLIASLRQGLVGALELLRILVQSTLQVLLVLAGLGIVSLAATLIPAGLVGVVAVVYALEGTATLPRFRLARIWPLLRESSAFAAAGAVSIVYLRVPVLLGPGLLSKEEFGAFTVAFRAMESLTTFPAIVSGALFPVLTHAALHDRARLARGYELMWRSTLTLGVVGGAAVIGAAPLISLILSGTDNAITVDSLAMLGVALSALFVGAAGMWMLLAERRYKAVLLINTAALSANVALTLWAGHVLGPGWFALGIVASELFIALTADRVIRSRLSAGGHKMSRVGPPFAAATLALTATIGIFVTTRDMFPLVPFAAGVAAAAVVILVTRLPPPELVSTARAVASRLAPERLRGSSE